jgi:hypothetical protein
MEEIKNEIVRSCPLVISDGTKPLRVNFHQYGDCSLEVIVDVKMLPLFSISNIESRYHTYEYCLQLVVQ